MGKTAHRCLALWEFVLRTGPSNIHKSHLEMTNHKVLGNLVIFPEFTQIHRGAGEKPWGFPLLASLSHQRSREAAGRGGQRLSTLAAPKEKKRIRMGCSPGKVTWLGHMARPQKLSIHPPPPPRSIICEEDKRRAHFYRLNFETNKGTLAYQGVDKAEVPSCEARWREGSKLQPYMIIFRASSLSLQGSFCCASINLSSYLTMWAAEEVGTC